MISAWRCRCAEHRNIVGTAYACSFYSMPIASLFEAAGGLYLRHTWVPGGLSCVPLCGLVGVDAWLHPAVYFCSCCVVSCARQRVVLEYTVLCRSLLLFGCKAMF